MKKRAFLLVVVAVLLFLIVGTVGAVAPGKDTFFGNGANNEGADLQLVSSSITGCSPNYTAYLYWDLSSEPPISTASLTLTTSAVVSGVPAGALEFTLYEVATDTWNETDTAAPAGEPGAAIQTASATLTSSTAGQTVVFDAAPLSAYLESERTGDGEASVAVGITSNCTLNTIVTFEDSESGANGPNLELTPTAVSMRSTEATNDGSAIFIWGGLIVAVALASAFVIIRRRSQPA